MTLTTDVKDLVLQSYQQYFGGSLEKTGGVYYDNQKEKNTISIVMPASRKKQQSLSSHCTVLQGDKKVVAFSL